jgi:two-component system, OmpR family, sensor kinase
VAATAWRGTWGRSEELVRLRLTLWFSFAVALLAIVGGLTAYRLLERQLYTSVDAALSDQLSLYSQAVSSASDAATLVDLTQQYLGDESSRLLREKGLVLMLQTLDGSVVSNSSDLRLEDLAPSQELATTGDKVLTNVNLPEGPYRIAGTPVLLQGERLGSVVVAGSLQETRDTMHYVTLLLALGVAAGTLAVGFGSWVLVGRALDPVRRITRTAATISREDLSQRIAYQGPADEIGDLAATMNEMLNRLQEAFEAQDQFVSDVSHELRTPLTIAKGHLQVLDRNASGDEALVRREHELVVEELDRMNRLVGELLALSRAKRVDLLRKESIQLDSFLRTLAEQGSHLGDREWGVDRLPGGSIQADQDRLTQVFLNLLQNAVAHTSRSQVIALGGARDACWIRLWVRDEGQGMSEEVREHVFERLYRAPDHEDEEAGLGLGLAIAQAIVQAHGGSIEVQSSPGAGARFTVLLPAGALPPQTPSF